MNNKKKYEEALERAKAGKPIDKVFPELTESEDERMIRILKEGLEGLTVFNYTPVDKILSWLEKKKEQKPDISNEAIREGIAHFGITQYQIDNWLKKHINAVEQKPAECVADSIKFDEGFKTGREVGFREGVESVKTAKWSENDKEMLDAMIDMVSNSLYEPLCPREEMLAWLKAPRPWKPSKEQPDNMIQWTGQNLREVVSFTGKSPKLDEYFKSWEEFEQYVHAHNDIFKLFFEDGSHYEVPVGAWIVKTPDGYNVPSVARFVHTKQGQPILPGIEEPGIPGKDFIPVEWVDACERYGKWKIVKQEQPEVELDREIIKYKVPFTDEKEYLNETTLDAIARHFAEWGAIHLNARKEE